MQHLICKKAGGGGGVHLHFWGRRLVIYKIKSIKDLRLVIINGTRHPRQEHRRSDGRMRGIECCRTTRVAKVIVLSSFDFFFLNQGLIISLRLSLQSERQQCSSGASSLFFSWPNIKWLWCCPPGGWGASSLTRRRHRFLLEGY